MPLLETHYLTKKFKNQFAVRDVSLSIPSKQVYGLLGPNGAGKSTSLKIICGLLHKTSGDIIFDGHPWSRSDLTSIGALIENAPLYDHLTARENLKVRTLMLNLNDRRIDEVLDIVDLRNTEKKKAGQFSMGMRQRLGIAIALVNHPKLLILDEPTNGLDPEGIRDLRALIKSFPDKGVTVIVSSHNLPEIEHVADHIGIINHGILGYQAPITPGQDLESLFLEIVTQSKAEVEKYANFN